MSISLFKMPTWFPRRTSFAQVAVGFVVIGATLVCTLSI